MPELELELVLKVELVVELELVREVELVVERELELELELAELVLIELVDELVDELELVVIGKVEDVDCVLDAGVLDDEMVEGMLVVIWLEVDEEVVVALTEAAPDGGSVTGFPLEE